MGSDGFNIKNHDPSHVQTKIQLEDCLLGIKGEDSNWRVLFPEIIGKSRAISEILQLVSKVARSNSSVLILGESGTGKELIASAIHRLSERRHHCFVAINCSAIPEDLLEAELFGHEKGAFTGADKKRVGYFGVADQGTIFLDEIGDMPPRLQAKLLRVLQEKKYTPVGSNVVQKVDVRIVAATNKDLEAAVNAKSFRLDLYYRLNVFPVRLPTLAEREGDLELLLEHFVEQMNWIHPQNQSIGFDEQALDLLKKYSWPGNVRQLQNLVERLMITREGGIITPNDLPQEFFEDAQKNLKLAKELSIVDASSHLHPTRQHIMYPDQFGDLPRDGINLNNFIEELENNLILQALDRTQNNKNQAAKLLGLNRTTLVEKIKKRNIRT